MCKYIQINAYLCVHIYVNIYMHIYVYILTQLRVENLGSFEHKAQSRIWDIESHVD